jgi:hypothetical protein
VAQDRIERALRAAFGGSGERAARAGLSDDGDAEVRAAWRALALAWYRRELDRTREALRRSDAKEAQRLKARLSGWCESPALRPYRDGSACIPREEHVAWQEFMEAVDDLRAGHAGDVGESPRPGRTSR